MLEQSWQKFVGVANHYLIGFKVYSMWLESIPGIAQVAKNLKLARQVRDLPEDQILLFC